MRRPEFLAVLGIASSAGTSRRRRRQASSSITSGCSVRGRPSATLEERTRFRRAINLKTAKALGLAISPLLPAQPIRSSNEPQTQGAARRYNCRHHSAERR
jgi:hypothetical protein